MIHGRRVTLYRREKDTCGIIISMNREGKIHTYWYKARDRYIACKTLYGKGYISVRVICKENEKICITSRIHLGGYLGNNFRKWVNVVVQGHRYRGFDVSNINRDMLEEMARKTKYCPICDVKLAYSKYTGVFGSTAESATCDRMYNETYLAPDNIWILCRECNAKKSNQNITECCDWCKKFLKVTKDEI